LTSGRITAAVQDVEEANGVVKVDAGPEAFALEGGQGDRS
jgi:hypothetical protein